MSTNNTEGLNFKIVTMGRDDVDQRQPSNLKPLTLSKLFDWIDAKSIDIKLKAQLKKSASKYPQQALGNWQNNYSRHVAAAQLFLRKQNIPQPSQPVDSLEEKEEKEEKEDNNVPYNDEFDTWNDG